MKCESKTVEMLLTGAFNVAWCAVPLCAFNHEPPVALYFSPYFPLSSKFGVVMDGMK